MDEKLPEINKVPVTGSQIKKKIARIRWAFK